MFYDMRKVILDLQPALLYAVFFFYQVVAGESHEAAEEGLLSFKEGDVVLVLSDPQEVSMC